MKKEILFEIKALYRDNLRVTGYCFGGAEKSACILGNLRGNEIQQIYTCSLLIRKLKKLEEEGKICSGKGIMVIPSGNPYSVNSKSRFWATDHTDINRMFPGYNLGETTQRIAAGIFDAIKDYEYGMQFTSFYMPGNFIPHIRMMKTGLEKTELAKEFGMPYVILRNPRPYDTTTLNYNWQIWDTAAFSVYTTSTEKIDEKSAAQAVNAILNFLNHRGIIKYRGHSGYISTIVEDSDMTEIRTEESGFFINRVQIQQEVKKGQLLAEIMDPYEGTTKTEIRSPIDGEVFFMHNESLVYTNTAVFKIIAHRE
ncbi:MAG: M14 family metallopeptidase [Lachnospiraceae bacterium]